MQLDGMHVGILGGEGVEDLEFWVTLMRLREEGARVTSIGLAPGTVHGKNGLAVRVDAAVGDVDAAALDGLVVPGGWMPDKLRRYPAILDLVRSVHAGATWVDEPAFRDRTLVWGRVVDDIPAFCRELVGALADADRA